MKSSISSLSISGSSTAAVLALLLQTPTSINAQQSNNIDTFDDIANLNTTSNSTQEAIDTLSSIGLITTPAPPIDSNSNTNNNEAIDIALEQTNSTELQEAIDKLIAAGLMTPTDDETVFQGGISSTVQTDIQTTINEQLVSNILTLDEFNEVRLTESPADFGQLEDSSSYDSEKLWRDAAIFEYEVRHFGFVLLEMCKGLFIVCLILMQSLHSIRTHYTIYKRWQHLTLHQSQQPHQGIIPI